MSKKKLCGLLAVVIVAVLAIGGLRYTRPVDVYALGSDFEPEIISISRKTSEMATANMTGGLMPNIGGNMSCNAAETTRAAR